MANVENIKMRFSTIRARTWTLTITIVISLILYLFVKVITNSEVNWVEFAFLCILQMVIFSAYFPEGENHGKKDEGFVANKGSYNQKATNVNKEGNYLNLCEYCDWEFKQRKETYIKTQCSKIGIDVEDLKVFKTMSPQEIKSLKVYEFKTSEYRKIIFNRYKRRLLSALLFNPLPVEANQPSTIMSGLDTDVTKSIKDGSIEYRKIAYIKKAFIVVVIGGLFSYISFISRDNFGIEQIQTIFIYFATILITAITAFSAGEICMKIYKSQFYLYLSNFLDNFDEWMKVNKKSGE